MEQRDYPSFSAALLTVAEAFGRKIPDSRVRLYFGALKDLSLRAVGRGLERAVRDCEHFPSVSVLRHLAYERPVAPKAPKTSLVEEPLPSAWTPEMREAHALAAFALVGRLTARTCMGEARVRAYRAMAAQYPGVGWEEAAEFEALREKVRAQREERAA